MYKRQQKNFSFHERLTDKEKNHATVNIVTQKNNFRQLVIRFF